MMYKLINKKTFRFFIYYLFGMSILLFGVFNTRLSHEIEANGEILSISEKHDNELKKYARFPSEYNCTSVHSTTNNNKNSLINKGCIETFDHYDFEHDRIEIILTKEHSSINGEIDYEYFKKIQNVKSISDSFHIANHQDITKDRFRQMLTIELQETGKIKLLKP